MTEADPIGADIVIVGAGPTGLTLALLLARRGMSVLVAEKEAAPYALPRAATIDHQIVRVFQELGVANPILATCRHTSRYDFLAADGQVLLRLDGTDEIGSGGWPSANMIHQPSIERTLREAVAATEAIDLRCGWSFETLDAEDDGVALDFTTDTGVQRVRARYVVGADGARSRVRMAVGIGMDDLGFDEPWMVLDTIVKDQSRLPEVNLQICDPARPTTCVLMGEGRHRWEFMIKPGETPEQLTCDAMIARLLAPWNVEGAVEIERKAVYRFTARVAEQWRSGRILVAGDAAHQMPPFAGQGLCSGIRDAANLAWKLSAVVRDGADDCLLDSYQIEREGNVRAIIGMAMMMGRTVCITDPVEAAARDERMLAARAAGQDLVRPPDLGRFDAGCVFRSSGSGSYFPQPIASDGSRLDDLLGPGAWLLTRDPLPDDLVADGLAAYAACDPAFAGFAAFLRNWLEGHEAAAVLVRPDRHIFGTGMPGTLVAAWHAQLRAAA